MVKPPKYAIENAKKALECLDKGSTAMLRVGRRRAGQLANNRELGKTSLSKIYKFKRHIKNAEYKGNICKDNGAVAWLGWGLGYKNKKPNDRFSKWAKNQIEE